MASPQPHQTPLHRIQPQIGRSRTRRAYGQPPHYLDFQPKEYAKLTQAHLEKFIQTMAGAGKMIRWQSEVLKPMVQNSPPLPPLPDLDLSKMAMVTERGGAGGRVQYILTARRLVARKRCLIAPW